LITRRSFLKGLAAFSAGSVTFGGYALAEPFRLGVTRYQLTPPRWPAGLSLRLAVLADIHACEPWLGVDRLRQIVARTNALAPDAILLLGDYVVGERMKTWSRPVPNDVLAATLGKLKAPLGVHAVLGNHDWWSDPEIARLEADRGGPTVIGQALEANGIPVYENKALRLEKNGAPFWLVGLGDQWAFWTPPNAKPRRGYYWYEGTDNLPAALAQVTDDAPVVLMAHEPDIFPEVPDRVALTVCGHTHGGQVRLLGYAPIVPSRYGQRYLYGHITEGDRSLIVSAGLGCGGIPVRFGSPPEIVMIELGAAIA
jgi:predicted MPP superfamily phosphohydrolase